MYIVTTETIPGHEIVEALGIARGNTVQARNVGRDVTQALRNLTGGELKAYSTLLTKARNEALLRLEEDAHYMGADAVVNVRLETSQVTDGGSEVIAYGTAVKLKHPPQVDRQNGGAGVHEPHDGGVEGQEPKQS